MSLDEALDKAYEAYLMGLIRYDQIQQYAKYLCKK